MTVHTLISRNTWPLRSDMTAATALEQMEASRVRGLPVLNDEEILIGTISEADVLDLPDDSVELSELRLDPPVGVHLDEHIFEAARLMVDHQIGVLAVLTDTKRCIGVVRRSDLFDVFIRMFGAGKSGAILEVEMLERDYSLGKLTHTIEQNGARILSMTMTEFSGPPDGYIITLKLDVADVSRIRHVLDHYGYNVILAHNRDSDTEDIKKRVEEFMRYLDT